MLLRYLITNLARRYNLSDFRVVVVAICISWSPPWTLCHHSGQISDFKLADFGPDKV